MAERSDDRQLEDGSLDVPVSVIADIDILNERETFKELYETLGGVWEQIESHWTALSNHLQTLRPPLDASQVKQRIEDELKALDVTKPFSSSAGRNIRGILKSLSPWDHIKTAGRNAIGRGQPILQFDQLLEKCGTVGLWIVPVGELEGFCRTIEARHGPDFAMKVLSQRDIETDPELEDARQFMRAVWGAAS
ncbi:hypothetical protein AB8B21_29200 [Tardiphaga sp. 866_E4_N2_1]|uniref:hypothetical protein n=1 Tax=unclassified Tardiphaga TaxID=2631404 RepID=UPI003F1F6CA1